MAREKAEVAAKLEPGGILAAGERSVLGEKPETEA